MTHMDSSHHSSRPQTNGEERFLNTFLARPPAHLPTEALACASRRVKACAAADMKLFCTTVYSSPFRVPECFQTRV